MACLACLAMTYARGAFLTIVVILAGYGILRDKRILLAVIVVIAGILLLDPVLLERMKTAFSVADTSSEMRIAMWESTVQMIMDHPLLGIGWGAYWMVYPLYDTYIVDGSVTLVHAHNIYLNYPAEIGRDKKFVLYVDDLTAANHYYSFIRTDHSSVDITSGYNTIEFSAEVDCPFQLGWSGSESVSEVYVNNVAAEPIYAGGSTFEIRPNDGDVIKAYMKAKPALHTVTFSHSVDVGKVQATVDKINKLDLTTTESIQVLTGTEIDFNCLGYIVKVNDEETTESETGEYKDGGAGKPLPIQLAPYSFSAPLHVDLFSLNFQVEGCQPNTHQM